MSVKKPPSTLGLHLSCVLTEESLESPPGGDVLDALYLTTIVARLLEVDFQVVLQVFLISHVLNIIQEDGALWSTTEGLQ